jgi:hypothetical protein
MRVALVTAFMTDTCYRRQSNTNIRADTLGCPPGDSFFISNVCAAKRVRQELLEVRKLLRIRFLFGFVPALAALAALSVLGCTG